VSLNKIPVCGTAKVKEGSFRTLEMEALGRQTFGPVGTLVEEVALGNVFPPVHCVTLSLSFNEC